MTRFYQVIVLVAALACALGSLVAHGSNKNVIYCYVSSGVIGSQPTRIDFSNNERTTPLSMPNVIKRWVKELKNDNRFMRVSVSQVRYMQRLTFREGFVTIVAMTWLGTPESADCSWGNASDVRKETAAMIKARKEAEAQEKIRIAKIEAEAKARKEIEAKEAIAKEEAKAREEALEATEFEAARVEARKQGVEDPELVRALLKAGLIKLDKEDSGAKEGETAKEGEGSKDSDLKR